MRQVEGSMVSAEDIGELNVVDRPRLWIPLQPMDYAVATTSENIRRIIKRLCPGATPLSPNKLFGLIANELRANGVIQEVLSLGIGLPKGLPPLPGVRNGLLRLAENPSILETYPPTLGLDSTREIVATDLSKKSGIKLKPSEVMITHGAENALHVVLSKI